MKHLKLSFWFYLFYGWYILYQYASIQVLQVQSLKTHSKFAHDFQLVGVFTNSLYFNTTSQQCNRYSLRDIQLTQAMIYTIQELINNNSTLLPAINIGWTIIDSCSSRELATFNLASTLLPNKNSASLSEIHSNNLKNNATAYSNAANSTTYNSDQIPVIGIIGEKSDFITSLLAGFTSSLRYSQIGYESFSSKLDDRHFYPYFYRSSATTSTQTQTFINICKYFNWNQMPVVLAGSAEIINILPMIRSNSRQSPVCFDPIIKLYDNYTVKDLTDTILEFKNRIKPNVVLIIGREAIIFNLLKQAEIHNLIGITYLGSYSWLSSPRIYTIKADVVGGAIGITFNTSSLEHFSYYLNRLDFCNNKNNPWFINAWRQKLLQAGLNVELILQNCKIDNKLKQELFNEFYNVDVTSIIIMDSLLAFAYTLRDTLGCNNMACLHQSYSFDRDKFNRILSTIKFAGVSSSDITLKSDGHMKLSFDVITLQEDTTTFQRRVRPVKIGYWSGIKGLVIEKDKIIWNGNRSWFDIPSSRCSPDCLPGYFRYTDPTIKLNLRPCCWNCLRCPVNHVSKAINSLKCLQCSTFAAANANRTLCIDFPVVHVKSDSPLSIIIISLASLQFICLVCIWTTMITKRNTPVVKGSNFILVNILLFFIAMCIPTASLYLLPISSAICQARIFAVSISQVGIYLTILCKTNQVSLIFKSAMMRNKKLICLTKSLSQVILIFTVLFVVTGVLIGLNITMPVKINRHPTIENQIQLSCYIPNNYDTITLSVWLGLISITCSILAYKARTLPENFNESRYIFLSSILIFIVYLCSLPTMIILNGIIADSVAALTILLFGMSPMFCLFVPKLYIIYFRPELNTKQTTMASITNFTVNSFNYPGHELTNRNLNKISPQALISKQRSSSNN